jgi:hypothetical protein
MISILSLQLTVLPVYAKEQGFTPEQKKIGGQKAIHALFDYLVHQSAIVESAADFGRIMLGSMKEADRKAIVAALAGQKKFPTFQRKGDLLVADNGLKKYELKYLTIGKYDFELNGIAWSYDPKRPFLPQYEKLDKKLTTKKHAGVFNLLPEAEAAWFAPIAMMIVGAVVGSVGTDAAKESWCAWDPISSASCADLRRLAEESLYKDAPALDAVSNQAGSDNKNILAQFESDDWNCPTNNDGKDREYRGRLRKVEVKDGKAKPTSNWFNVVAKFNPQGFPTDLIITRENSDPATIDTSSRNAKTSLVIDIKFDPTKKKPISYRLPNPTYDENRDLLGSPTVTLTPALKLTPLQKDSVDRAKDIVKYINYRNYNCVAKQVEAEQLAGVVTRSPAQPPTTPERTTSPEIIK